MAMWLLNEVDNVQDLGSYNLVNKQCIRSILMKISHDYNVIQEENLKNRIWNNVINFITFDFG